MSASGVKSALASLGVVPDCSLGCNDELCIIAFQKGSDDVLGNAHTINIRGIEKVNPHIEGRSQRSMGLGFRGGAIKAGKAHATQADLRHLCAVL